MAAASSPFEHFHSVFNADEVVRRYEDPDRRQVPGHFVNFFGVATPGEVLPEAVSDLVGQVESSPLPSNWHADTAEFAAALRAVDLASSDAFTMIELGCGWGCWMNITAAAAKRRGVSRIRVIGI